MTLPTSRNNTYTPASQVYSNDLNAIQDCIIGHKRPVFGQTLWPRFMQASTFTFGTNPVNASYSPCFNSSGSAIAIYDVPFEEGDRLVGFKYWAAGNGTTDVTSAVISYAASGLQPLVNLAAWTDTNRAAAWSLVDVGAISSGPTFTPTVMTAGGVLFVQIQTNAGGYSLGPIVPMFDRL